MRGARPAASAPSATGATTSANTGTLRTAVKSSTVNAAATSRSRSDVRTPNAASTTSTGSAPSTNAGLVMLVAAHSLIEWRIGLASSPAA